MNDGGKTSILVHNKRSDRQRMPPIKRANLTTETVGTQSTVCTVCLGHAINASLRTSEAGGESAHRGETQVFEGEG